MELIPLKANQPTVTFIPIVASELPFFSLTNKKNLAGKIDYRVRNGKGEQIGRWRVFPDATIDDDTGKAEIGRPGVEAHRVWYLLIKPAIDASKRVNGKIPNIIPLGGVRKCLRSIGWSEGGHQSRELLKALRQIAFASIIADLPMPIGYDENKNLVFKQLKGNYNRMSVYSIGEQHLTAEQLKQGNFQFNIEDEIYIKLDPLEVIMQEGEAENQKLIDNEYMFSVNAAGRRWYELLANKVFGVVKNRGLYFDISYNWYIERHHTLKKFDERFRVVRQMNRVVRDHLAIEYLSKVEYRKIKDENGNVDFLMRYYVGHEAKSSIKRIQGYLLNQRRKRPELTSETTSSETDLQLPTEGKNNENEELKPYERKPRRSPEEKLIKYFIKQFFDGKAPPMEQGKKQLDQARQLIGKHGDNKAKFIVKFASEEANKTNFNVQVFGAVLRYEAGATTRFAEHQANLKRREEQRKEEAKQREEERRWQERRELGSRLFKELPEKELEKLQERFTKKVQKREGWAIKLDSPTQRSLFMTLVNDEIKDYLVNNHDQEKSKSHTA